MIKVYGSLCILSAALWGWRQQRRECRQRCRVREDLLSALRQMGEAIRLARTPLPALFRRVAAGCETAEGTAFFRTAGNCAAAGEDLAKTWTDLCGPLPLTEEERRALVDLSHAFGGDEDQLCRAAALSAEVLQRCAEESRCRRTEEDKRNAALWLSGGALAVILLI